MSDLVAMQHAWAARMRRAVEFARAVTGLRPTPVTDRLEREGLAAFLRRVHPADSTGGPDGR